MKIISKTESLAQVAHFYGLHLADFRPILGVKTKSSVTINRAVAAMVCNKLTGATTQEMATILHASRSGLDHKLVVMKKCQSWIDIADRIAADIKDGVRWPAPPKPIAIEVVQQLPPVVIEAATFPRKPVPKVSSPVVRKIRWISPGIGRVDLGEPPPGRSALDQRASAPPPPRLSVDPENPDRHIDIRPACMGSHSESQDKTVRITLARVRAAENRGSI